MLIPEWESVASKIANAKLENKKISPFIIYTLSSTDLKDILMSVIDKYSLDQIKYKPVIQIARDTR